MTKRFLILLTLLCAAPFGAWAAGSTPLDVRVDHGIPLTLSAPAASVFIANPEIADVQVMSPTSIMIFGKRTGETTFMATDNSGNTLAQRTVIVTQDLSSLRRELNMSIPDHKIRVAPLPNGLVLTGEAKDAATIQDAYKLAQRYLPSQGGEIINRIRVVGSNQIQLRVRFAEVARNIDDSLGFNWQNLATVGGFAFGIATGISGMAVGESILSNRPNNTNLSLPNNAIGFSRQGGHFNVNGLIDALAQNGLITILAEPNLTAMSGETANFLAGGEFPIPVPQGNNSISIEFKNYGISLAFTPTLIGENRINIHVKPEVSELTTTGSITLNNIAVPALLTRKAETTIEVASGQSFAIAGLLDNNQSQTVNKYPLLGDLPVLGALFRSNRYQNGQTELVIIITPYIVRPTGEQLALPMDGLSPPSEAERLFGLRYSGSDPNARPMSGAPTGKRVEQPAVSAAPVVPVETTAETETPSMPASAEVAVPEAAVMPAAAPPAPAAAPVAITPFRSKAPARANSTDVGPAGPGGFILE
ncbi:MAG: type II and III secretion system protein family protein [Alphaproteobacteria bacterium]|nr:type II and III secretion system protein family protein [Alphaproteobacteria bacterium]